MFTVENEKMRFPVKVWLKDGGQLEAGCLEQALRLADMPFLHKWVCLMPDAHVGMGMPIGGVIAAKDVIIPNAVGVDIGCGMAYIGTDIRVSELREIATASGSFMQALVGIFSAMFRWGLTGIRQSRLVPLWTGRPPRWINTRRTPCLPRR
jgi:tRNA-splicing ligase RtcB